MKLFHHKAKEPAVPAIEPQDADADAQAKTGSNGAATGGEAAPAPVQAEGSEPPDSRFDRLLENWMLFPFPDWPQDRMQVEHLRQDGALVVRATLPALEPDNDVELTVCDGVLWIDARHRAESRSEDHGFVSHEIRYGTFSRSFPLPDGVTAEDIRATYRDGLLEILIPVPERRVATKVAITTS